VTADGTRVFDARRPSMLSEVRRFIHDQAGPTSPPDFISDLQLAVTEACANAMLHSGSDEVRVTARHDGRCLEVLVEDDGIYRASQPGLTDDAQHRGIHLMTAMVDDFHLTRGTEQKLGTVVRLVKCAR
jgi:anti-sigma regulatory factor (Ser/Thr protein kinase)